jgi:proprotein convertase subtilisin/kexin type 5
MNNVDGDGCNADCTIGNNNGCPVDSPFIDPATGSCASACSPGYYSYMNATNFTCLACLYTCGTCTNATDCLTCSATSNRYLNGTQCLPNPGFFDNTTQNATACVTPCATCTSATVCLSCVNGSYFSGTTLRKLLYHDCQLYPVHIGYDLHSVPGWLCSECDHRLCDLVPCTVANCSSCPASPSTCVACIVGYSLNTGSCVTVCGDNVTAGTEQCDDGNTVDGDGCNADCTTGNNNGCPASTPYKDPLTNLCTSTCPSGYFPIPAIYSCPACLYTCGTCTNATDCLTCSATSNRYLNGTQCLPNPGFFDNTTQNATACVSPCATCTSATACVTCVTGSYLSGATCVLCSTAIVNCAQCTIATACTQCQLGFIVNATTGLCDLVPCTVTACVSCPYSNSVCDACATGFQLRSNLCVTVCGDNVTAGTEQCDDGNTLDGDGCNADCTTGNNNNCPASSPYRNPLTNLCTSTCPGGYFADPTTFTCLVCFYTCGTCNNATDCSSCLSSTNRYLNGTQCLPNPGFFDNTTQNATVCVSPCATCTSATACVTCVIGSYLTGTTCMLCSAAMLNCSQCSSSSVCTQCQLGFMLNATTGACDVVPCTVTACVSCPVSNSVCDACATGFS